MGILPHETFEPPCATIRESHPDAGNKCTIENGNPPRTLLTDGADCRITSYGDILDCIEVDSLQRRNHFRRGLETIVLQRFDRVTLQFVKESWLVQRLFDQCFEANSRHLYLLSFDFQISKRKLYTDASRERV